MTPSSRDSARYPHPRFPKILERVCRISQRLVFVLGYIAFRERNMCLAVPGKIVASEERDRMRIGRVQFGGIVREVRLDFVPEACVGDYVMVHVGFAISRVDSGEAERAYKLLEEMGTPVELI